MAAIDIHCHIIPESCLPMEAVGPDGRTYGFRTERDASGALCPVSNGRINRNCEPEQLWDLERRLRDMDRAGVDIQVLSPAPFLFFYNLTPQECSQRARRINTAIAEIATARPDRFRGMATVPMQDPELAISELEYAINELGLHGLEMCSNIAGKNLDEPQFQPFFETVQQLDVPIFVHPTNVAGSDRLQRHYLGNLIGNPLDTAICIASLIFGGILDAYPRLKMIFAHGGGHASFVVGRWNHGRNVRPECQALPKPPVEYLKQLYYDTLCHDTSALQYLVATVGSSQIVLGTDYPFDMGDTQPLTTIASLASLSDQERANMHGETAARLYKITV
jgi:aminocarboxymuconate-semialdehyde decarboxylase